MYVPNVPVVLPHWHKIWCKQFDIFCTLTHAILQISEIWCKRDRRKSHLRKKIQKSPKNSHDFEFHKLVRKHPLVFPEKLGPQIMLIIYINHWNELFIQNECGIVAIWIFFHCFLKSSYSSTFVDILTRKLFQNWVKFINYSMIFITT